MCLTDRHDQHGRRRGQHGAEREDAGIDAVDGNGESLRHLAVILRGAHDEADPGSGEHKPGRNQQQRRGGNDKELVAGIAEPGQKDAIAEGRRHRARLRSVEAQRKLLDDVEQTDSGNDGGFGVIIQPAQHQPLRKTGDRPDHERRRDERCDEANGRVSVECRRNRPGKHRPQHEELAMGDVDYAHDAEDERQAECGKRQHRRGNQAFERCEKEMRAESHSAAALFLRCGFHKLVHKGCLV